MTTRELTIDWKASPAGLPLFQRIAEGLAREIRRGRLRGGDRIPSSRKLADTLDVHRNTVLAAFRELESQGYLVTEPARGTFVTGRVPDTGVPRREQRRQAKKVKLRLAPAPSTPRSFVLASSCMPLLGGLPDLRQLPIAALTRSYRAALRRQTHTLDYQSIFGQPRFIEVFGRHLAETRGVVANEGEMLVTRGSQQALHLAARALWRPGSVIAVERAGYPPAWEGFRLAGAEIVPIRTDRGGLVVDDLARLCEKRDVAAVYVTPHHQYPTTVTMTGPRRIALLGLARKARFAIIEDDYDHEFHFESQPVLPLGSMDHGGSVLHIGTLSKIFAPGIRLGYAVGNAELIASMAASRAYIDRQGDHTTELALALMIEDGELQAHVRRMHRSYVIRREALFSSLREHLGPDLCFERPSGGLALWAKVPREISANQWAERASKRGVLVQPASIFYLDGRDRPYLRLGYARLDEHEIRIAVERLARARPTRREC